jgi:PAS domain S-box-containing protein
MPMSNRLNGGVVEAPAHLRPHAVLRECAAYRRNLETGTYEYVSPMIEAVTGFSADEMYAMTPTDWLTRIHPEDCPRLVREAERLAAGDRVVLEYRFRHKDGQYHRMAERADIQPEPDGRPRRSVGFLRSLEDRRPVS